MLFSEPEFPLEKTRGSICRSIHCLHNLRRLSSPFIRHLVPRTRVSRVRRRRIHRSTHRARQDEGPHWALWVSVVSIFSSNPNRTPRPAHCPTRIDPTRGTSCRSCVSFKRTSCSVICRRKGAGKARAQLLLTSITIPFELTSFISEKPTRLQVYM